MALFFTEMKEKFYEKKPLVISPGGLFLEDSENLVNFSYFYDQIVYIYLTNYIYMYINFYQCF